MRVQIRIIGKLIRKVFAIRAEERVALTVSDVGDGVAVGSVIVAGEDGSVVHAVEVEDIVANAIGKVETEVNIAPSLATDASREVDTTGEIGSGVTNDSLIVVGNLSVAVAVLKLNETRERTVACIRRSDNGIVERPSILTISIVSPSLEVGSLVPSVGLESVDISNRFTLLDEELGGGDIVGIEAGSRSRVVAHATEVGHLAAVSRDIGISSKVVVEFLRLLVEDHALDRELETLVLGGTDVAELVVVATGELIEQDKVLGIVPVEVEGTADTVVEETIVETKVARNGSLPLEFRVRSDLVRTADGQVVAESFDIS